MVTAIFILIFKKEKNNKVENKINENLISANARLNVTQTYKAIVSLFKIKSIRLLALILLTVKVITYKIHIFLLEI